MSDPRVIAVDCGAGHAACAEFSRGRDGRLKLGKLRITQGRPDLPGDEEWLAEIGAGLAAMAQKMPGRGAVRVALPSHHALTKFIRAPVPAAAGRSRIIAFEAQQNIPYELDEVIWDHVMIDEFGGYLEAVLTAVKGDLADRLCSALTTAGFPPRRLEPACFALHRAYRHNYPAAPGCTLVVAIGARATTLLYVEADRFWVRTITLAGNNVTQEIAGTLGQDFTTAEQLKLAVQGGQVELPEDSPAKRAVVTAAASFTGRLLLEISRSTLNYRRQSGGAAPMRVLLTGGGSLLPGLAAGVAEKLPATVEAFDPLREVGVADESYRTLAPWLAEVVGLALPWERDATRPNLLPPARRTMLRWRQRAPRYATAAGALLVGMFLPGWHYHRLAQAGQAKARELTLALQPLAAAQARNEDNLARLEQAWTELRTLQDLVVTRNTWIDFLADLQSRLLAVEDVWLEKVEVLGVTVEPSPRPAARPVRLDMTAPPASLVDPAPLRLKLTGRLLDRQNPVTRVSEDAYERVKSLLAGFVDSPFIAAVENERFDAAMPGILRFDFILVVDRDHPL